MKKTLDNWTQQDRQAGLKVSQAWADFFASSRNSGVSPVDELTGRPDQGVVAAVRARQENKLLAFPNVVGMSEGIKAENGIPTGQNCIIVYVSTKVSREDLPGNGILPASIEGVAIDVVEIGNLGLLSR